MLRTEARQTLGRIPLDMKEVRFLATFWSASVLSGSHSRYALHEHHWTTHIIHHNTNKHTQTFVHCIYLFICECFLHTHICSTLQLDSLQTVTFKPVPGAEHIVVVPGQMGQHIHNTFSHLGLQDPTGVLLCMCCRCTCRIDASRHALHRNKKANTEIERSTECMNER